MSAACCLLGFAGRLERLQASPATVQRELEKLPDACMDTRCSPGGCRQNCAAFAAGVILKLNGRKPDNKPPKAKGKTR